jgi:hypothetical protein
VATAVTPEQERKANDYANGLIDRIANAGSDAEIVAICKETEKAVMRLKDIGSPRFHHIVNWVHLRRARFKAEQERHHQEQQDLFR